MLEPLLQLTHSLALVEDVRLVLLLRVQNLVRKLLADLRREPCEKLRSELSLFVERDAEAETELGVVFEKRVAPGRAATSAFCAQESSAGFRRKLTNTPSRWRR